MPFKEPDECTARLAFISEWGKPREVHLEDGGVNRQGENIECPKRSSSLVTDKHLGTVVVEKQNN